VADQIKCGVVGATGYAGFELARLLRKHPNVSGSVLFRRGEHSAATLDEAYPQIMNGQPTPLHAFSWEQVEKEKLDLLFLATPHETSWELVPEGLRRGLKVIDLSGAWRLKDEANRKIYKLVESAVSDATLKQSVYGSPELHGATIRGSKLVANPGCYATSVILALAPFAIGRSRRVRHPTTRICWQHNSWSLGRGCRSHNRRRSLFRRRIKAYRSPTPRRRNRRLRRPSLRLRARRRARLSPGRS